MTVFSAESFDVAVIGAGHAGIEAALAAARLGAKQRCFRINLDAVAICRAIRRSAVQLRDTLYAR